MPTLQVTGVDTGLPAAGGISLKSGQILNMFSYANFCKQTAQKTLDVTNHENIACEQLQDGPE